QQPDDERQANAGPSGDLPLGNFPVINCRDSLAEIHRVGCHGGILLGRRWARSGLDFSPRLLTVFANYPLGPSHSLRGGAIVNWITPLPVPGSGPSSFRTGKSGCTCMLGAARRKWAMLPLCRSCLALSWSRTWSV